MTTQINIKSIINKLIHFFPGLDRTMEQYRCNHAKKCNNNECSCFLPHNIFLCNKEWLCPDCEDLVKCEKITDNITINEDGSYVQQ